MSNRIVLYKLVEGYSPTDVERGVNYLINDGWQPFGSFTMTEHPDGSQQCMIQPMVLTEETCSE